MTTLDTYRIYMILHSSVSSFMSKNPMESGISLYKDDIPLRWKVTGWNYFGWEVSCINICGLGLIHP